MTIGKIIAALIGYGFVLFCVVGAVCNWINATREQIPAEGRLTYGESATVLFVAFCAALVTSWLVGF